MKTIEKKSLTKTQRLAIILSSVLVLLIVASVVLTIVYANLNNDDPEDELPDIRAELGESMYGGLPVAYGRLEEAEILSLVVTNEHGKFDLTRWPDENGVFWLGYDDGSGENRMISYIPPIVDAEGDFDYESLYAIEEGDGYGRWYMLSHLCSAIGTVYFSERIDLPEDDAERAELLLEYGLAGEGVTPTTVSFAYELRDGENKLTGEGGVHHVQIGVPALNGDGFYYRVDGRNCVYYTKYSNFKYAKLGFEAFVKGALVAAGLEGDKTFEPLLTTQFTEWKNTMHEDGFVTDGSSVISVGNVLKPIKESSLYTPDKYPTGYDTTAGSELKFDLTELAAHPDRDRIIDALLGREVGAQDDLVLTMISELYSTSDMIITFGEESSVSYRYEITAIESVLDAPRAGGGALEIVAEGSDIDDGATLLRVSYDLYVGGEKKNTVPRHAVLDITSPLVSDSVRDAIRAARVGALSTPISLEISYTKQNALSSSEALIVSDIIGIYSPNGAAQQTAGENSYVSLKYYEKIDGVAGAKKPLTIKMSDIKNDAKWSGLYSVLLGRSVGVDLELTAYSDTYYHEIMRGFITYEITEIECYVTSEEVVSFRFVNESERDPFYGASLYENLTGRYKLYGVDVDICQEVLRILGGLEEDTTASLGLSGETVAVGLTHELMKKYNLYDYTIYLELPRDIDTITIKPEDGGETIEDYQWMSTLGFTLYVSRPDPATGKRYVGSDMYDLVAKVDADVFEFIDESFVDFWARRNMIMLELGYVDKFKIDFFMEDVKGSYDFEINKQTVYVHPSYGNPSYTPYEGAVEQDYFTVYVTESGDVMTDTELHKFSEEIGSDRVALHALYNKVMGGGEDLLLPNSVEWVGVSNFMLAFQVTQLTSYGGSVTDSERALASEDNKLMKITIGLDAKNASSQHYVYEFYRVTDRKVMVKTYKANASGEQVGEAVSDLWVSTFAFKKMVNAYLTVFNAGEVDGEIPYADERAN